MCLLWGAGLGVGREGKGMLFLVIFNLHRIIYIHERGTRTDWEGM